MGERRHRLLLSDNHTDRGWDCRTDERVMSFLACLNCKFRHCIPHSFAGERRVSVSHACFRIRRPEDPLPHFRRLHPLFLLNHMLSQDRDQAFECVIQ